MSSAIARSRVGHASWLPRLHPGAVPVSGNQSAALAPLSELKVRPTRNPWSIGRGRNCS